MRNNKKFFKDFYSYISSDAILSSHVWLQQSTGVEAILHIEADTLYTLLIILKIKNFIDFWFS